MVLVFVHVVIILLMSPASRSIKWQYFVQEPVDISLLRNYPLLEMHQAGKSTMRCATLCAVNAFCSLFLTSATLNLCALYGMPNQTTVQSTNTINNTSQWKSYVFDKPDCRYLYVKALNKCWMLSPSAGIMSETRQACINVGGDLIQFKTMEAFDFMRYYLLSIPSGPGTNFWIGTQKSANSFCWLGTSEVINSALWDKGQPDGFGSNQEFCADAHKDFQFYLNDMKCDVWCTGFCEIPISAIGNN